MYVCGSDLWYLSLLKSLSLLNNFLLGWTCRVNMPTFSVERFFLKVHLSNYCIFQCQVHCQFVLEFFIRIDLKDERRKFS